MALIAWRESFEIGIESVDHEHRELIELINELHDGLGRGATRETVADFLGEIHARISAHFALEERVMRELEYDEYAEHKEDHETLLDDIRDIMDAFDESGHTDFEGAWASSCKRGSANISARRTPDFTPSSTSEAFDRGHERQQAPEAGTTRPAARQC